MQYADLSHQAGTVGAVAQALVRLAIGGARPLVVAGQLADVSEQLAHARQVRFRDVAEVRGSVERPTELRGRVGVGVKGGGALAGQAGALPGSVPAFGGQPVQREQLDSQVGPSGAFFDGLRSLGVQQPSLPEGKPFVRGVPDQRMREDQLAFLFAHELRQARPQAIVELHVVLDDSSEEVLLETRAQHRGGPQGAAVGGGQTVDPGGQEWFESIGKGLGGARGVRRPGQFDQEQRIAVGPSHQHPAPLRAQLVERELGQQVFRRGVVEGAKFYDTALRELGPPGAVRTPGQYHEPGTDLGLFRDAQHQARRSLVESVGVFEYKSSRAADQCLRELDERTLQSAPAEARLEVLDLHRRGQRHVEHVGEQRRPRKQRRSPFLQGGDEGRCDLDVRDIVVQAEQLARRGPERPVRASAAERVAGYAKGGKGPSLSGFSHEA